MLISHLSNNFKGRNENNNSHIRFLSSVVIVYAISQIQNKVAYAEALPNSGYFISLYSGFKILSPALKAHKQSPAASPIQNRNIVHMERMRLPQRIK